MTTKLKNRFNAVAESRKWRQQNSALLATMSSKQRLEFINRCIADFPTTRQQRRTRKLIPARA